VGYFIPKLFATTQNQDTGEGHVRFFGGSVKESVRKKTHPRVLEFVGGGSEDIKQ